MRVAFITSGYENMGVEFLSSQLKKEGHEVRLFFDPKIFGGSVLPRIDFLNKRFDLKEKIIEQVLQWDAGIIGFSCMTHNYMWCIDIAREIKKISNIPVIFGGIHPTLLPEEVLSQECVDMVAVGEAEVSFLKLLSNMKRGTDSVDINGIYFKRNGKIISNPVEPPSLDLDSFAFLDKDLFYEKISVFAKIEYAVMASKGCPFSCFYCCNDHLKRLYKGYQTCRRRGVKHVIDELKLAKRKYNMRRVVFYDEIFPSQISWLEEFCKEYKKEIDLPFLIYYRFELCDEKRVSLLKSAGCSLIGFGLQSASERVRREICNRPETNAQVADAIQLCKKYKIQIAVDHIFGLPTETEEETKKAVRFYRGLSPDMVYSYWLVYYPKASIIDIALRAGLLTENDVKMINSGEDSYYHKGTFINNRKNLLKYELLFDLIPLLSSKWHRKISESKIIFRILPGGLFLHFFFLSIVGMKLKPRLFLSKLELLFSKKSIP